MLNEEGDETDHSEAEGEDDSPSQSKISVYGKPASADEIYAAFPPEDSIRGGLVWHARLCYGDAASIKSRRGTLDVHVVQFLNPSSVSTTGDGFFSGVLNGWPGMKLFQVVSITYRRKANLLASMTGKKDIRRFWSAASSEPPSDPKETDEKVAEARVTLLEPSWTLRGYTPTSPGFVWWFFAQTSGEVIHGENIFRKLCNKGKTGACYATRIHRFSHRYAKRRSPGRTN